MKEIWKDIPEYEELYQVSNLGNVRRKKSIVQSISTLGKVYNVPIKQKEMKQEICKDYKIVGLCKNGKRKNFRVHRLVAMAFIPNPNNYLIINHIDGNKQNNCVNNLEWCTYSHNEKEAFRIGLKKPTFIGKCYNCHPTNHKIIQLDLKNNPIKIWNSIQQAQDCLNISNISAVCRNKQKTAGGFKWKYFESREK